MSCSGHAGLLSVLIFQFSAHGITLILYQVNGCYKSKIILGLPSLGTIGKKVVLIWYALLHSTIFLLIGLFISEFLFFS
jgi:hypothetical protein